MDGYTRMHPEGGYGLGRHAQVRPPEQSAQALAEGTAGATTAAPDAQPQTPQRRAAALLSQRVRPQASPSAPAVTTPPAPSLAAPPPPAPAPSPLAKPPEAPAPAPLAPPPAPAAPAANQWGIDFSTNIRPPGWSDTMEALANPNAPDRANVRAAAADPRSNPNNTMSVFYDPAAKQGDRTGYYNDFDNPALRVNPNGQRATLAQAGITPGSAGDPTWNPSPAPAAPAYTGPATDADQALLDYQARQPAPVKSPPIVDSIPPPDQLPGYVNPANTQPVKPTYFTGGRR